MYRVIVEFIIDTPTEMGAFMTTHRIFSTLSLPDTVQTMTIKTPEKLSPNTDTEKS